MYHIAKLEKGTGLVSVGTAKIWCDFFTLNSCRPSNDYDVSCLVPKQHCQKLYLLLT